MSDEPNNQQERIAAVEAQRPADDEKAAQVRDANKLRKRAQRAREREARERIAKEQQARLAAEAEAKDQELIRRERITFIKAELENPESLDEVSEDGSPWRKIVEEEIELYLLDRFGGIKPPFEFLYTNLLVSDEGRLILNYYGVELLPPPPEGWIYLLGSTLQLFHPATSSVAELWERDELEGRAKQGEEMKKAWMTPPLSPQPRRPTPPREVLEFLRQRNANLGEAQQQETARKKAEWADHLRVLKLRWDAGRAAKGIRA